MAHDWGHLLRQGASAIFTPDPMNLLGFREMAEAPAVSPLPTAAPAAVAGGLGPESCEGMVWAGGVPPKGYKVVNYCGQGVLRKIRRRRRRRLLTASDVKDIGAVVALVGKGQLAASIIANVGR